MLKPHPLPDAAQKNTSKTEIKTGDSHCEYVPLVEIIYKEDHKRVDQLVKTLRTYVKSIGELNMFINRAKISRATGKNSLICTRGIN